MLHFETTLTVWDEDEVADDVFLYGLFMCDHFLLVGDVEPLYVLEAPDFGAERDIKKESFWKFYNHQDTHCGFCWQVYEYTWE